MIIDADAVVISFAVCTIIVTGGWIQGRGERGLRCCCCRCCWWLNQEPVSGKDSGKMIMSIIPNPTSTCSPPYAKIAVYPQEQIWQIGESIQYHILPCCND